MQMTAKADYALRAATVAAEDIPLRFLHNILAALTRAGILSSLRGADGGYELTRAPAAITVADVIRAVEGLLRTRPRWRGRLAPNLRA